MLLKPEAVTEDRYVCEPSKVSLAREFTLARSRNRRRVYSSELHLSSGSSLLSTQDGNEDAGLKLVGTISASALLGGSGKPEDRESRGPGGLG